MLNFIPLTTQFDHVNGLERPPRVPSRCPWLISTPSKAWPVLPEPTRGVARMLQDGRFDVSALDQERLTEILSDRHASQRRPHRHSARFQPLRLTMSPACTNCLIPPAFKEHPHSPH